MLKQIISESGQTQAAWAKRIGCGPAYLSCLLNGKSRPSLEMAVRIERETEGRVSASSWISPPVPNVDPVDVAEVTAP